MTGDSLDLRLAPAALATWLTAAAAIGWPSSTGLLASVVLVSFGLLSARTNRAPAVVALLLAAAGAAAVASLRGGAVTIGPVPGLAAQRAQVSVDARVVADPVQRTGSFAPFAIVRVTVQQVTGRGATTDVASPVVVIGDDSWSRLRLGQTIRASGRLAAATTPDVAAALYGDPDPVVLSEPSWVWRAAGAVREGIGESVSRAPPSERALVPALVDGQESAELETLSDDFQASGLTHLLAVSGSNLTLVLSFTLLVARLAGIRAHGLTFVAVAAVVFFVVLARPEPSVLRAAAMGVVGIAGLAAGGRRRGSRSLCVAVLVLLLLDPWLARSPGFLLSTLATAGILVFGRPWREALATWMPAWLAEAVAVPLAAQVVCTPVVAALSGTVSVVAVAANVAAAPAVGPATVLGLVGGLVAIASDGASHLVGAVATAPAWWIVWVAETAAGARGALVAWPVGAVGVATLAVLSVTVAAAMRSLLARPAASVVVATITLLGVLQPWGRLGWPPRDWLLAMCDVGQGDALALHVADGSAVVIDAGPDPRLVDRCLDDLDVSRVPLVVLTHFHADHVDGLPGVLGGRQVGQIEVSPLAEPADGAAQVRSWAADAHVPVVTAVVGESWRVGDVAWTTLGPTDATLHGTGGADSTEGSAPNNASVVMRVDVDGYVLLLTGDAEPEEQDAILAEAADLHADVVKVSHHGSGRQNPDFYAQTGASVALISVGADNDYGHPAPETVDLMASLGMRVYRTDLDGTVVVAERGGRLVVIADG
jgi:competence protein ComEC